MKNMLRQVLGKYKRILLGYFKNRKSYAQYDSDTIFICGAPVYGNLGDQAILLSEYSMLSRLLPGRNIVVIPEIELYEHLICLKKESRKNHSLCILMGGGNMGDLYTYQENVRLLCIKKLKKANIIVFPQSIDYKKDSELLQRAKKIYESHKSLHLFVREENSEKKRTDFFPNCNGALVPDIVLYYHPNVYSQKRIGVLFCTRSDKEKRSENEKILKELEQCVTPVFTSIKHIDTYSEKYRKPCHQQKEQLQSFWSMYNRSELVITDRLHGMIFALITGTPCIALDNSTGKVKSVYETWLKDSGVIFVDSEEALEQAKTYITSKKYQIPLPDKTKELEQAFLPLKECILKYK